MLNLVHEEVNTKVHSTATMAFERMIQFSRIAEKYKVPRRCMDCEEDITCQTVHIGRTSHKWMCVECRKNYDKEQCIEFKDKCCVCRTTCIGVYFQETVKGTSICHECFMMKNIDKEVWQMKAL
jgi:hypothetical protein